MWGYDPSFTYDLVFVIVFVIVIVIENDDDHDHDHVEFSTIPGVFFPPEAE